MKAYDSLKGTRRQCCWTCAQRRNMPPGTFPAAILTGKLRQFHYADLCTLPLDGSVTLLDTRTPMEYEPGHVQGFINIPLDELRERMEELDRSKMAYVMCQSGLRSYLACRILSQNGFNCYNFSGGYHFYQSIRENRFCENVNVPCGFMPN